ncbi:MAG: hypothetical protein MK135_01615 [Polyangiaceae bacterium]|nr:hypothetical protein [Polyangiaceae bacterium]
MFTKFTIHLRAIFLIVFATCCASSLVGCSGEKDSGEGAPQEDGSETAMSQGGTDEDPSDELEQNAVGSDVPRTVWTGALVTFTKESGADPNLPSNQDRLTESIALTRGTQGSLYNVETEMSAQGTSPEGTLWAEGTTDELDDLTFETLKAAANNKMNEIPGKTFVLHLVAENIYLNVTFLSWKSGQSGGGFSYERSSAD